MDFFWMINPLTWFRRWREKRRLKCTVTINKPNIKIRGKIQNLETNTYRIISFLGIPYALPPTEEYRFQPPKPLPDKEFRELIPLWKAYDHAESCIQYDEDSHLITGNEDCLYLDVYIPNKPKHNETLLPVLVYIHGGGFSQGSAKRVELDDLVGKEKCVCVTIQYRLGALGFLNMRSDNCRGNAGMKDQVMALQWIKNNIEPFGGNPENVTLYGESAGGTCINLHLISPMSKGLFHRAIIQSGGIYSPWGYGGHARKIKRLFKRSCDKENELRYTVVELFKGLPAKDFLKLSEKVRSEYLQLQPGKIFVFLKPSVECIQEDAFLPDTVENLMSAAEAVPTIAGITRQEGYTAFRDNAEEQPVLIVQNESEFFKFLKHNFNWTDAAVRRHINGMRDLYFPNLQNSSHMQIMENLATLITDIFFRRFYDNFKIGNLLESGSFYVYLFDYFSGSRVVRGTRDPDFHPTASEHGDDMLFLLEKTAVLNSLIYFESSRERAEKRRQIRTVIDNLSQLWASFCRDGTPKCLGQDVEWIPHTEKEPGYLRISERLEMCHRRLNRRRWHLLNQICRDAGEIASSESSSGTSEEEGED